MSIYLIYLAAFLVAFVLTYLSYRLLVSWQVMDLPNDRSSHLSPTPRGGGIAIVIAFFAALFLGGLNAALEPNFSYALIFGGASIAAIGFIDDVYSLKPSKRFIATLLVTGLCVLLIGMPSVSFIGFSLQPSPALFVLEVIAILWILNLFNFMDGIDAIASLEAISVLLIAAALLVLLPPSSETLHTQVEVLLIIAFATVGFLIWNWPPAKVFMGDVSSSFLGFVLALFAAHTSVEQTMNVWVWLILLGLFFLDAFITMIRRVLNKEKFYQPHRQHVYQRLALYLQKNKDASPDIARAYAHKIVSLLVLAINFLWLAPWAYMAKHHSEYAMLFALISLTPLLILFILAQRRFPSQ